MHYVEVTMNVPLLTATRVDTGKGPGVDYDAKTCNFSIKCLKACLVTDL